MHHANHCCSFTTRFTTSGLGITFRKSGYLDLVIYNDSSYSGSLLDHRFHHRILHDVRWKFGNMEKQQKNVDLKSSTEAELRALSSGIDEVLWIRSILQDLQIAYEETIRVLCDNKKFGNLE